jgi:hypothetical protein
MPMPKREYTLSQARLDNSEDLFVYVNASRNTKVPTTVVLSHTSRDSGETRPIPIPMTTNPINLADYVPRDEILRNTEFLRLLRSSVLVLVSPEEADKVLATEQGRAESDRLRINLMRQVQASTKTTDDVDFRVLMPADLMATPGAKGSIDSEAAGVTPAVAGIMLDPDKSDAVKASLLRNIMEINPLTDIDKKFIREKSADEDVRSLVAR